MNVIKTCNCPLVTIIKHSVDCVEVSKNFDKQFKIFLTEKLLRDAARTTRKII